MLNTPALLLGWFPKAYPEDHRVEISFRKILYPPALDLKRVRMTKKAWIVEKCYPELSISITESSPADQILHVQFLLFRSEPAVGIVLK